MPKENTTELSENTKRLVVGVKDALITIRELLVAIVALLITLAESREKTPPPLPAPLDNDETFVIEPDEDQKQMSLEKENNFAMRTIVSNLIYPVLATVSTISLVIGIAKISPIAQWARSQNSCIESSLSIDGVSKNLLATKVKNCNGGHD